MTGRLVVTQLRRNGYHVEQVITPEMLHARAGHDIARADRIGDAAVASLSVAAPIGYFRRAFALAHRLFDRAQRDAAHARRLMRPAPPKCAVCRDKGYVLVQLGEDDVERDACLACEPTRCENCGRDFPRYETVADESAPADRYCRPCDDALNAAADITAAEQDRDFYSTRGI